MKKLILLTTLACLLSLAAAQAQHINAGAFDSDGNSSLDKLYFVNGSAYVNTSGYIFNTTYRTSGIYSGYYDVGPSFTALAAFDHSTPETITASPFAVAGSFLKLQIVSVSGVAGGTLSYWGVGATLPTFSLVSGGTASGNESWNLTDPSLAWSDGTPAAGLPGSDPYGHIHGQRFTVDLPGTYLLGLRIIDTSSTNLASSDTFYINVAAVPEPSAYALFGAGLLVLLGMAKWKNIRFTQNPRLIARANKQTARLSFVLLVLGFGSSAFAHVHISAGVQDSNSNGVADQGDKLYFTNGSFYQAGTMVWNLSFQLPGQDYGGFYISNVPPPSDTGFTFAVQAATLMNGGPAFAHPAEGSFIQLRIVSVSGPVGGHFSWWEADDNQNPTATFATGLSNGTFQYDLSEGANSPDSDPYGHVHGRTFGVDLPGLYTVGFQLVDTSVFGAGGGAIHPASDIYFMDFSAIPEPGSWALLIAGGIGIAFLFQKKKKAPASIICLAAFLGFQSGNAQQSPAASSDPWTLLFRQSTELLQALKDRDTRQIHELAEAIEKEAGSLQSQGDALDTDQKTQFQAKLKDIAAKAAAIHHDAHQSAWDKAQTAQTELVETIKRAQNLLQKIIR